MQIGPALSALDADVSYQAGPVQRAKDYKRAAQHSAAAQEARGMLGEPAVKCLRAAPGQQQALCSTSAMLAGTVSFLLGRCTARLLSSGTLPCMRSMDVQIG